MPISIEDVAKRAGVSRGTVSHVLNGNVRARIALSTQERVRQAAAELGYHPNRLARSLGRRRTDILGLIISGLQNPFFLELMESAEQIAQEAGYEVLLDAAPVRFSASHFTRLQGWPVDGAVMWAEPHQRLADYLRAQAEDLPVVYLGGQPRLDDSNAVYFDVYHGALTALHYLVAKGYRRIGFLYPYEWVWKQLDEPRHRAYREVCTQVGMPVQMIPMERQEETRHSGLLAGIALAEMPENTRPDAVLCFNDVVAEGVLFGLRRRGLRVPDDIGIVGFDGIQNAQFLDVPLTTVRLPAKELCREALRLLLSQIGEGPQASSQQIIVPAQLIVGGTA